MNIVYNKNSMSKRTHEHTRLHNKYHSSLHYVLSALVPYTEANLKLSFSPNRFFNDLEKLSDRSYKVTAVRGSYYRALNDGLIVKNDEGMPQLTEQGVRTLNRYQPKYLQSNAAILVIFDIPESHRHLRRKLRTTLRELYFKPVQQSVWQTEFDVLEYLTESIRQDSLEEYVQVYESIRIM